MTVKVNLEEFVEVKNFNRSAKMFLLATVIGGFITSGWSLFFNLFILARGFDKEFLGIVNIMPSLASLIFTIPLGMLSDRLGRKRSMILGTIVTMIAYGFQITTNSTAGLIILTFLVGIGNSLHIISNAPFMMSVSSEKNRALLFSVNFGLQTLAGMIGNLFAGFLPKAFSRLFAIAADTARSYQAVLMTCLILGTLMLIPMFLINDPGERQLKKAIKKVSIIKTFLKPHVWRLFLPNFILGTGAALLIPYMNVFFREEHKLSSDTLGLLFSLSALITGLGSIVGPWLARKFKSKIKTIVFTQAASLGFLLLTGFSPIVWLAAIGFLLRAALMNMANPLYSAFAMEQTEPVEQGAVNSVISLAWNFGWAICPYISGLVQANFGFRPLFITTFILYTFSTSLVWIFFRNKEKVITKKQADGQPVS